MLALSDLLTELILHIAALAESERDVLILA